MDERNYQRNLIKKLERMFPNCFILKPDPQINQGVTDIIILFGHQWAALEIKIEDGASKQPNQDYYVAMFDDMSFAAFINPDNEEMVLDELQSAFGVTR